MKIKVPGDLPADGYGQMYYVLDKHGVLALCGDAAPTRILNRFRFELTAEEAKQHGLGRLINQDEEETQNG